MIKKLKYENADTALKLRVINSLRLVNLSDTESAVLAELIDNSSNNITTLTIELNKQIRAKLNMNPSLFNTCIHRLQEKGTLKKEGKTLILNPLYNNLSDITQIVISFQHHKA
jgi:predicted transcriptional regulator